MKNQSKKLRLDELTVESFITSHRAYTDTIKGQGISGYVDCAATDEYCDGSDAGGSVGTCPDGGSCGCTNANMPCTTGCPSNNTWCGSCPNNPCPGGNTNPGQCTQPTNCGCLTDHC